MNDFRKREEKMPVLFLGHGNPMYAIEESDFAREWENLGKTIAKPEAVLCVSAHWETEGTFVSSNEKPGTIHDFYGFPEELFAVEYPAPGSPLLAEMTKGIIKSTQAGLDLSRGLDHGCWAVMKHIFPSADIPIVQLSIALNKLPLWHYELGKELTSLRNKGVLIAGSGNMVHNLRLADWHNKDYGYEWAYDINDKFKELINAGNNDGLINYKSLGKPAELAIPTPEHYLPLLYILGLKEKNEPVKYFNDVIEMGSMSMTSLIIG